MHKSLFKDLQLIIVRFIKFFSIDVTYRSSDDKGQQSKREMQGWASGCDRELVSWLIQSIWPHARRADSLLICGTLSPEPSRRRFTPRAKSSVCDSNPKLFISRINETRPKDAMMHSKLKMIHMSLHSYIDRMRFQGSAFSSGLFIQLYRANNDREQVSWCRSQLYLCHLLETSREHSRHGRFASRTSIQYPVAEVSEY